MRDHDACGQQMGVEKGRKNASLRELLHWETVPVPLRQSLQPMEMASCAQLSNGWMSLPPLCLHLQRSKSDNVLGGGGG